MTRERERERERRKEWASSGTTKSIATSNTTYVKQMTSRHLWFPQDSSTAFYRLTGTSIYGQFSSSCDRINYPLDTSSFFPQIKQKQSTCTNTMPYTRENFSRGHLCQREERKNETLAIRNSIDSLENSHTYTHTHTHTHTHTVYKRHTLGVYENCYKSKSKVKELLDLHKIPFDEGGKKSVYNWWSQGTPVTVPLKSINHINSWWPKHLSGECSFLPWSIKTLRDLKVVHCTVEEKKIFFFRGKKGKWNSNKHKSHGGRCKFAFQVNWWMCLGERELVRGNFIHFIHFWLDLKEEDSSSILPYSLDGPSDIVKRVSSFTC